MDIADKLIQHETEIYQNFFTEFPIDVRISSFSLPSIFSYLSLSLFEGCGFGLGWGGAVCTPHLDPRLVFT